MDRVVYGRLSLGPIVRSAISDLSDIVIVNELDNHLSFEGHIAEEIMALCGDEIASICLQAAPRVPIPVGSALRTEGGNYPFQIIHAVVCERGCVADFLDLCDAVRNAVLLAETGGIPEIVIPAIGSYVGRLTPKQSIFTILEHLQYIALNANFTFLHNIRFCATNDREEELFRHYFSEIFGRRFA